jgi:hypothetical protein
VATSDSWFPEVKEIWGRLQDAWHGEAKQWTFGRLAGDHVLDGQEPIPDREVKANEEYLGISLRSLWIANTRVGWTTFYPAVHAFISAPAFIGPDVEFHVLTTPANIKDITAQGLDRVIVGNQRLLGPLPYWGGDLRIELALFAIKAEDLAAPFLAVLGDLSAAAGGGFATTALAFANPLKNGIALLTGGAANSLEIGYFGDAEQPRTGYYTAIRSEGISLTDLWLKQGYLVDGRGQPLRSAPYFVFSIDATPSRPDWRKLPGLEDAWSGVTAAGKDGDATKLERAYERVKRMILSSDDLLTAQMDEIIAELDRRHANLQRGLQDTRELAVAPIGLNDFELPSLLGATTPSAGTREVEPVAVEPPGR